MNFNDVAKAHVRTVVPVLVGLVVTLALRAGLDLHGYTPFITSACTAVYYSAARLAEEYVSPRFGWLLGVATKPKYGVTPPRPAAGKASSVHTIAIQADTSQAVAALKEVTAAAKEAKRAADAVKAPRRRIKAT